MPELSVARAQTSVHSKSNNPLAFPSEESCPTPGHITQLHKKLCVINIVVIITVAGNRNYNNGSLNNVGGNGNYWSSTVDGTNSRKLNFNSGNANMNSNNRANGLTVRCLKDLQINDEK